VTLEQDLARRDLTVNAMAQDADGRLIDPFHGQRDLQARVLRHVTDAFREDPVRILRLARFAARFADFSVAPETMALMREMTAAGEVDALVAERVWQELARGLMEARPSRMFDVMRECDALAKLLPEVEREWGPRLARIVDESARRNAPLPVRFACVTHALAAELRALCERLRVPVECRELAEVVAREHANVDASLAAEAGEIVRLLERCDAWRKPQRFEQVLLACHCIAGTAGYPQGERLMGALRAALAVPTHEIAAKAQAGGITGPKVGEMIHAARIDAVAQALGT
jgi:tRNA nucleotidyltransferase (CCA-adding enzyme)